MQTRKITFKCLVTSSKGIRGIFIQFYIPPNKSDCLTLMNKETGNVYTA